MRLNGVNVTGRPDGCADPKSKSERAVWPNCERSHAVVRKQADVTLHTSAVTAVKPWSVTNARPAKCGRDAEGAPSLSPAAPDTAADEKAKQRRAPGRTGPSLHPFRSPSLPTVHQGPTRAVVSGSFAPCHLTADLTATGVNRRYPCYTSLFAVPASRLLFEEEERQQQATVVIKAPQRLHPSTTTTTLRFHLTIPRSSRAYSTRTPSDPSNSMSSRHRRQPSRALPVDFDFTIPMPAVNPPAAAGAANEMGTLPPTGPAATSGTASVRRCGERVHGTDAPGKVDGAAGAAGADKKN